MQYHLIYGYGIIGQMENSVDPDQLPSSEADLDLHCLKRRYRT